MSSTRNRLRLSAKILTADTPTKFPYIYYLKKSLVYYIMPNSNLRYAECIQLGRLYINLSQASLDRTRKEY